MKRAVPQYFPSRSNGGKGYALTPLATSTNDQSHHQSKSQSQNQRQEDRNNNKDHFQFDDNYNFSNNFDQYGGFHLRDDGNGNGNSKKHNNENIGKGKVSSSNKNTNMNSNSNINTHMKKKTIKKKSKEEEGFCDFNSNGNINGNGNGNLNVHHNQDDYSRFVENQHQHQRNHHQQQHQHQQKQHKVPENDFNTMIDANPNRYNINNDNIIKNISDGKKNNNNNNNYNVNIDVDVDVDEQWMEPARRSPNRDDRDHRHNPPPTITTTSRRRRRQRHEEQQQKLQLQLHQMKQNEPQHQHQHQQEHHHNLNFLDIHNHEHNHNHTHSDHHNHPNLNHNNHSNHNLLMFRDEEEDAKSMNTNLSQRHLLRSQGETIAPAVISNANGRNGRNAHSNEHDEREHRHSNHNSHRQNNNTRSRFNINTSYDKIDNTSAEQSQSKNKPKPALYSPIAILKIKNKSKSKKKSYLKPKSSSKSKIPSFSPKKKEERVQHSSTTAAAVTVASPGMKKMSLTKKRMESYYQDLAKEIDHVEDPDMNMNMNIRTRSRTQTHSDSNRSAYKYPNEYVNLNSEVNQKVNKNRSSSGNANGNSIITNNRQYDNISSTERRGVNRDENTKYEANTHMLATNKNKSNQQQSKTSKHKNRQYKVWNEDSEDHAISAVTTGKGANIPHVITPHGKKKSQSVPQNEVNIRNDNRELLPLHSHDEMSPLPVSIPMHKKKHSSNKTQKDRRPSPTNRSTNPSTTATTSKSIATARNRSTINKVVDDKMSLKTPEGSMTTLISPMYPYNQRTLTQTHSHDEMSPLDTRLGIRPKDYSESGTDVVNDIIANGEAWKRYNSNQRRNKSGETIPLHKQDEKHDIHNTMKSDFAGQDGHVDDVEGGVSRRNIGQGYRYNSDGNNVRNHDTKIKLTMRELTKGGQKVIEEGDLHHRDQSKSNPTNVHRGYDPESKGKRESKQRVVENDAREPIINTLAFEHKERFSQNSHNNAGTDKLKRSKSSQSQTGHLKNTHGKSNRHMNSHKEEANQGIYNDQKQVSKNGRTRPKLKVITNPESLEEQNAKTQSPVRKEAHPVPNNHEELAHSFDLDSKVDQSWAPSPIKVEGSFAIFNHDERDNAKVLDSCGRQEEEDFMHTVAAIVIQTFFRRHLAYRLTLERYSAVITIQRFFHSIIEERAARNHLDNSIFHLYDVAATQIQAAWRGWWVRDCVNVDRYCATVIQRNIRMYLAKCKSQRHRQQYHAATFIQSVWRGYNTKKKVLQRLQQRRKSLVKAKKGVSHSEKTLKTGTSRPNQSQTIAGGFRSRPKNVDQPPPRPSNIQRKTSRGSQNTAQNMAAMHTDDLVRRWKLMRERNRQQQNLAEF